MIICEDDYLSHIEATLDEAKESGRPPEMIELAPEEYEAGRTFILICDHLSAANQKTPTADWPSEA